MLQQMMAQSTPEQRRQIEAAWQSFDFDFAVLTVWRVWLQGAPGPGREGAVSSLLSVSSVLQFVQ